MRNVKLEENELTITAIFRYLAEIKKQIMLWYIPGIQEKSGILTVAIISTMAELVMVLMILGRMMSHRVVIAAQNRSMNRVFLYFAR